MKEVIVIEHLNKSYKDLQAVRDLSIRVKEGELFAFLGVNGAGKSTTINTICGQLKKDSGTIQIEGHTWEEGADFIKCCLGVVYQNSVLDKALSVQDNLEHRAALYGISGRKFKERLSRLADLLDFEDLLKRQVGKLSGGQRRRIDIARALLHNPKILILDEPTTGLDPQTRNVLWNVVTKLQKEEKLTVFLTTHYMEEAAQADYVVIIDKGEIVTEGTPLELKNRYTKDYIMMYDIEESELEKRGISYVPVKDSYRIEVENTIDATALILQFPEIFRDYEITKGKMDDVFLEVTGQVRRER